MNLDPRAVRVMADRLKRTKVLLPDDPAGCWKWLGASTKAGYGTVAVTLPGKRTSTTAHRLFYEAYVGPIPPGNSVHHRCANPSCVNPEHLQPVTQRENTAEMFARKALEASLSAAGDALDQLEAIGRENAEERI